MNNKSPLNIKIMKILRQVNFSNKEENKKSKSSEERQWKDLLLGVECVEKGEDQ